MGKFLYAVNPLILLCFDLPVMGPFCLSAGGILMCLFYLLREYLGLGTIASLMG